MTEDSKDGFNEDEIVEIDVADIKPSPENDKLYKPVSSRDPEIHRLAKSILSHGLREPIVLAMDNYIISGHRRYAACKIAGLTSVRCRRARVTRSLDPDGFVSLLREYNVQRVKTLDEQIREAVIDANPEEAYEELIEHRKEKAKVDHDRLSMGASKSRKKISSAKDEFSYAIVSVLNTLEDYWPVTDRQIHYGLLNNPPLKHSKKTDSRYQNDKKSYKSLVDMLTRMRLNGTIPIHAISDATRPITIWDVHPEPGVFASNEIDGFLKGYHRDLIQSQPNHIELVVEKNTVAGIVRPVCGEYCIPMTSARGYCSIPPRADIASRFKRSGKEKLIVLFVSDFDGDGEEIAASFARSMRDDFGVACVHPIKVALTAEQVKLHNLPPSMEAKESSSRTKAFVEINGKNVWELEALPPSSLQDIVRDDIVSVLDMDLFEREKRAEKRDSVRLHAVREAMHGAMSDITFDDDSEVTP